MQVTITLAMLRKLEQEGSLHIEQASSDITIPNTMFELVLLKPKNVATGAEIKDFWDNGWDGNYYHDDWDEPVQDDLGNWILEDGKLYNLDRLGYCCWQGSSSGVGARRHDQPETIPFVEAFLAWKGKK
jgi:hypothetical protein